MTVDLTRMWINGAWIAGEAAARPVINPTTGGVIADAPEATPAQALDAVAAARAAQLAWGRRTPLARGQIMHRIAALIRAHAEPLARLVVREQGKPIAEARGEVGGAAEFFTYFAEFARRIQGEILPSDIPGEQIWIQRVPMGVVVGIIPWNYPAALVSRKVAPALIAGNTIVLKPHEDTPLSALYMARLMAEAGVPDGVVNIVTGAGATVGAALASHPGVDLVTMTGSVPAGRSIMQAAAGNLVPVSLELGGKAPFIVMEDADLDIAVAAAVTSRFMNCGQVCICAERILVHDRVHDAFVARFIAATRALRIGDPMNDATDIGPKVSLAELEKVERVTASAIAAGAEPLLLGGRPDVAPVAGGFWLTPTVLGATSADMAIMRDEVFGPVVPILRIADFDEALAITNNSQYGLSAYLFTNDFKRIMHAVQEISFGEIYLNRIGPEALQGYHTGYRSSGPGGDDGVHGLEAYLRKKTVYANFSGRAQDGLMPYGG